ncbi:aldose epimerase family protein [Nakamurella leprariae]|uniref:Aldose 1-epimerase n=1 Tax=Nakamurella leprariae TaxID=2803911 RepID=A0A939C069_9ACTN|nr:aldose epimerase family protein [Nakamurella leprariae]MBM9465867.1 galactose mutarotase [Nakamurella leprariae]
MTDHRGVRFELGTGMLTVTVSSRGARICRIRCPDADGLVADVAVGAEDPAWAGQPGFFGAVVGRWAGRIGGGGFVLDGIRHRLPADDGGATLHGGPGGFSEREWVVRPVLDGRTDQSVDLALVSPDGEMGFPGRLSVRVRYRVRGDTLDVAFTATTDAPTVVNLTSHPYFNLDGRPGSVADHRVELAADAVLPVDATGIPTGAPIPVAGTPFDFRTPVALGARWRQDDDQLRAAGGYDHCFRLDPDRPAGAVAARVHAPASGRTLEIVTDQPGLQLYSGNHLDGTQRSRLGLLRQGDGVCLEPQRFPDAPNHPELGASVLRPGEIYRHRTSYRFSVSR